MAVGARKDPFLQFRYGVEIDGLYVGGFSEVSGLAVEIEVQEYREGGLNEYAHKFRGPVKHPSNLILKRGLVQTDTLWSWLQEVADGYVWRQNVSLFILDPAGEERCRWDFANAYPVRWQGPEFNGTRAEVAIETLELVHQGFVKTGSPSFNVSVEFRANV